MHRRLLFPLVLLLVFAAGCSSGSKHARQPATATGPAVPWTSARPEQTAERAPVKTLCRASGLAIQGQVKFVPRLTGGIALVPIKNTGKHACRLTGRPSVQLVKKAGPVQVQQAIPTTPSEFPEVTYPTSSLLALQPGQLAAVTISWDNWCEVKVPGKPHVPPSAVRITLPGGRGSIDANYNAVVTCIQPSKPSTIGVSVFQPMLVPTTGRPWTNAFLRASVPGQPVEGRRGGILHFRVVLKNASNTPARFDRCPAYAEQLVPQGPLEAYALNCKAAHTIEPGKSLAFAMEVQVPSNAPLGANAIFWGLDPFGIETPQIHARVKIAP